MSQKAAGRVAWRSGDGASRLYLGDSLHVLRTLPDESVDCVWTDPPYLLSNDGVTCVSGRMVTVNKGEWDRSRGIALDHEFNRAWLAECHRVLTPSGTIWVSGTLHVYLSVGMAMQELGFRILNDIVWEKPAPPPNLGCRCFTHASEILLWATKANRGGKARYTFHYDAMKAENGGRQMKNIWRLSRARRRGETVRQAPDAETPGPHRPVPARQHEPRGSRRRPVRRVRVDRRGRARARPALHRHRARGWLRRAGREAAPGSGWRRRPHFGCRAMKSHVSAIR